MLQAKSCRVRDIHAPHAGFVVFKTYCLPEEEEKNLAAIKDEVVVASQHQCAFDLDVPVKRVRAAVLRLTKRGLLTTKWVRSRSLVTKHKLGEGFRGHLVNMWVRAFCPVREVEQ